MRLVQISDLHLSTMAATAADGRMVRYTEAQVRDGHPNNGDNLAGLAAVLDAVEEQAPDFSRLVVTGDIAQDEQAETYGLLRDQLARRGWLPRSLVLPGNHEQRDFLREAFPEQYRDDPPPHGGFAVTEGGWRLVGVDTHDTDAKLGWDGEMETLRDWDGGEGRLGGEQLSWLRSELHKHSTMPTLVFMHHPPTDVGSRWLDEKGMIEAEGLSGFVRIVSPTYLLLKRPARCWLESGAWVHRCQRRRRSGRFTPATSIKRSTVFSRPTPTTRRKAPTPSSSVGAASSPRCTRRSRCTPPLPQPTSRCRARKRRSRRRRGTASWRCPGSESSTAASPRCMPGTSSTRRGSFACPSLQITPSRQSCS